MTAAQEEWTVRLAEQSVVIRALENEYRRAGRAMLAAKIAMDVAADEIARQRKIELDMQAEAAAALAVVDPDTGRSYTRDLQGHYSSVQDGKPVFVDPDGPLAARLYAAALAVTR